jgi:hypothetical protein
MLGESKELSIFDTKIVKDLYEFNWNNYAKHVHYLGATIHFIYFISYIVYVDRVYLYKSFDDRVWLCWVMLICLIYPMFYDCMQAFKTGLGEYSSDPWNYIDQAHIWVGIANIFVQRFSSDILSLQNTVLMVIVAIVLLIKSFFFLRIFRQLSALVSMLQ